MDMEKMTPENACAENLKLGIANYTYADLYRPERLQELHSIFSHEVEQSNPELAEKFTAYRQCKGDNMRAQDISDLLVNMAPYVGEFVARLFNVTEERTRQIESIQREIEVIFGFRDELIKKSIKKIQKNST